MLRLLFTSLCVALAWGVAETAFASQPNIVLIFSDDHGWADVSCYGSEIPTPHIDRIAEDGVKFTNWYVASSICTPSRYGLLTGRYPTRSQDELLNALMFLGEEDANRGLREGETTYVSRLAEAGYATALIGKWHLGHGDRSFLPTRHGFQKFIGHTAGCIDFMTLRYGKEPDWYHGEEHVDQTGYATDVITDAAVAYLQRRRTGDAPFYLHVAYNAPHFGKGWAPADNTTVNIMQPHPADLERARHIDDPTRRAFAAKVMRMDDGIGRLLDTIEAEGLANDTWVIFMTDHGGDPDYGGSNEPLRGGKATLYEGGIRVPCVTKWPGRLPAGELIDEVAGAIDLFPTFCRVAGIDVGSDAILDGQDLSPMLFDGIVDGGEREMFWHTGSHAELSREAWTALRQGDWKMVDAPGSEPELFDLATDPYEGRNLADEHPQQLTAMLSRRDVLLKKCLESR